MFTRGRRKAVLAAIGLTLVGPLMLASSVTASTDGSAGVTTTRISNDPPGDTHHDVSPPLRDIAPAPAPSADEKKEKKPKSSTSGTDHTEPKPGSNAVGKLNIPFDPETGVGDWWRVHGD